MCRDFQRCKRGQVWWIEPGATSGAVIGKTRPMLIISDPVKSDFGTVVTVAPITTMIQVDSIAHVDFEGPRGFSAVLCDQLKTVDTRQFGEYQGVVSDDVMERVEEGVRSVLHIKKPSITLKEISDTLERLMSEVPKGVEISEESILESFEKRLLELKETSQIKAPNKRRKWTAEDKMEFLSDSESMPIEEVQEKWNLSKRAIRLYQTRFSEAFSGSVVNINSHQRWDDDRRLQFLIDSEAMDEFKLASKYGISTKSATAYKYRFKNILKL